MSTSQFTSALTERIENVQDQLRAALADDDTGEVARLEFALADLERLRAEHEVQVPHQR